MDTAQKVEIVRFGRACTASRGARLTDKAKELGLRVVKYDGGSVDRAARAWRFDEAIEVEVPAGSNPATLGEAAEAWAAAGLPLTRPPTPKPLPYCRCGAGATCLVHPRV